TPIRWLYVALAAVAAAAIVLWSVRESLGPWAGAWMPNVGAGAATILITVAVVNRIIEQRERERIRPRLDRVLYGIGIDWRMYVESLANDYAQTHLHSFEPIPNGTIALIDHWLASQESEDAERLEVQDGGDPYPLTAAESLVTSLQRVRETDREVLEPDLIAAIDDLVEAARQGRTLYNLMRYGPQGDASARVEN